MFTLRQSTSDLRPDQKGPLQLRTSFIPTSSLIMRKLSRNLVHPLHVI